ncbi:MAG: Ig-like domain-containing protein [Candidatus Muiribacteriota bacterium]
MQNRISLIIFFILIFILQAAGDPLQVISVSPIPDSEYVPLNSNIEVTFNREIIEQEINQFTFTVNDGFTDVAGDIKYFRLLKKAVFIPKERLSMGRIYKITVWAGITDIYGNRLPSSVNWLFSTGMGTDKTRPFLISTNPVDGYRNLALEPEFNLVFSERINPSSYKEITFTDSENKKFDIEILEGSSKNSLRIKVKQVLPSETDYTLNISPKLTDMAGNEANFSYKINYRTLDNTPPSIIKTEPEADQRLVGIHSAIKIHVDDDMNLETINRENIKLFQDKNEVNIILNYDFRNRIIEIIPDRGMKDGSFHEVHIGKNILDKGGNPLEPYMFEFKTEDLTQPFLVEHYPADNEENLPLETVIKLKFSEIVEKESLSKGLVITDGDSIISYDYEINHYGVNVEITPKRKFEKRKTYRITLKDSIKDLEGNPLDRIYTFGFKTILFDTQEIAARLESYSDFDENQAMEKIQSMIGNQAYENYVPAEQMAESRVRDMVAPRVVDYFPMKDMKNVPLNSQITVIFTKDIDPLTLRNGIILSDGLMHKEFTFVWDGEFKKAQLTPTDLLQPSTTYRIILSDKIRDVSGNPLDAIEWKFTTADSEENIKIISTMPEKKPEINPFLLEEEIVEPNKVIVEELKGTEEEIEFLEDPASYREKWAKETVLNLRQKFARQYSIMTANPKIEPSRYELALILRSIINQVNDKKLNHLFRHRDGIKDMILLFQATVEFTRELEILGVNIPGIEENLKNNGIPVAEIREDLYKGILREVR